MTHGTTGGTWKDTTNSGMGCRTEGKQSARGSEARQKAEPDRLAFGRQEVATNGPIAVKSFSRPTEYRLAKGHVDV
jgi:hypothetical protein